VAGLNGERDDMRKIVEAHFALYYSATPLNLSWHHILDGINLSSHWVDITKLIMDLFWTMQFY